MGENDMSVIEFYYTGKMILVRCDLLSRFIEEDQSISATLFIGDIRRGLLINTGNGEVRAVHYTHEGMIARGYQFECVSAPVKSDANKMYDNSLTHEACEVSSRG